MTAKRLTYCGKDSSNWQISTPPGAGIANPVRWEPGASTVGAYTGKEEPAMGTAKEEIRRMLDTLPDDATWEDVQYSIYVRERVERARREAHQERLLDQDEVETRMKRWLDE